MIRNAINVQLKEKNYSLDNVCGLLGIDSVKMTRFMNKKPNSFRSVGNKDIRKILSFLDLI